MKKTTKITLGAFGLTTLLISTAFTLKNSGTPKINKFGNIVSCTSNEKNANGTQTAYTQSAHDQTSPGTCAGCHSGGVATPVPAITFSPALGANNTYTPGTVYTISYTVTGYPKFGFDLEINDGNTTSSMTAGTLAAGTHTRYTAASSYPANISHNAALTTGTLATFTWTAPSTSTTVYLFSNGLGVNGNGQDGNGDKEAFKNMILTAASGNGSAGIESVSINNEFKLFPNPAKDVATVNYSITKDAHVTINITDLNGKIVSTQVNEEATVGSYSKKLELSNLNSGTYFVKIKSDDNTVTKKLVIQ